MEEKVESLKQVPGFEAEDLILDGIEVSNKLHLLQPFIKSEYISLKNCSIRSLKGFPKLPNLKKLDLSSNEISTTFFFLHDCKQLTHLNLSNNKIHDIFALYPLNKLKKLQSLLLVNCEVTKVNDYRRKVFHIIKNLKDLDGQDKTVEDGVPPNLEEIKKIKSPNIKDRKRKIVEYHVMNKKMKASPSQKNPLMILNELKPGLKFVVDSVSGPSHNPQFDVSVEFNGTKFLGQGNSKQIAKHNAAQEILKTLPEFTGSLKYSTPVSMDFTTDNVENDVINYNKFESQKNGSSKMEVDRPVTVPKSTKKLLSEADKKNPVMLLNELHPGISYKLLEENSTNPNQRFRMSIEIGGSTFEGTGQNKKIAKASVARSVLSSLYEVSFNMSSATILQDESIDKSLFSFTQTTADGIANLLMNTFYKIMAGNPDFAKWKVIAGIAMSRDEDMNDIEIVGFGTGTKCISGEHISMVGANLNDCHAEIISRRCLKDFFYKNLEMHIEGDEDRSIFKRKGVQGGFCLKPNIKFHLYISTAPCGDARIFCPHEEGINTDRHPNRNSRGVLRTKVESGEGTIPIKSGQGIQTWDSILPGQERLLTMSCSDKIASWNVMGLQGALLSYFIEPVYLDSIILGGLFHPTHLSRALFQRLEGQIQNLPAMFRLNKLKMCAISSPETRNVTKSPNFSVNWTLGTQRPEIVNATTGKTETGQVSRLSKRLFFQRFSNIYERLPHIQKYPTPQLGMYSSYKEHVQHYQLAKKAFVKSFVDAGLGAWVRKPIEQTEFELVF